MRDADCAPVFLHGLPGILSGTGGGPFRRPLLQGRGGFAPRSTDAWAAA